MDKFKNAWRSVTLWFNALFLMVIGNMDTIAASIPQLQPYLKPEHFGKIMMVVIFANMALRFKTTQSLSDKGK